MGWGLGYANGRDIGYVVPAVCDQPDCDKEIDRGISYACGSFRAEAGCGQYFCGDHLSYFFSDDAEYCYDTGCEFCDHCLYGLEHPNADRNDPNYPPYHEPKPDILKWVLWKYYDESWSEWRKNYQEEAYELRDAIRCSSPLYVAELMLELVPQMEYSQEVL